MDIRRADLADLDLLTPLFDAYRQFYRQDSDLTGVWNYLHDRLDQEQAVVFLAMQGDDSAGFTLLYPTLSSVAMAHIWILNDLYVDPDFRRQGVGKALLLHAKDFCQATGAYRMGLATEITNTNAQALYESLGWVRDDKFYQYSLRLNAE